jgi:hypothetical protein
MSNQIAKTNLALWNSVEKTDPSKTKDASVSGQKRTAVDAQYKKKMITEAFGPYGIKWGVVVGSESFDRTHFENQTCILHYMANAYYLHDGERGEFPIAASIKESYVTKNGSGYLKIDDEAIKKVRTDALTKGFTDLGFCADIHMGMFDDQDYVRGVAAEQALKEADDREAKQREEYQKIKDYIDEQIKSVQSMSNPAQAVKAYNRVIEKVDIRCQAAGFGSKGLIQLIKNEQEKLGAKQ